MGLTVGHNNSGAGNITGPASATPNALSIFNGTTGKLIKDSGVVLTSGPDDFSLVAGDASLNLGENADVDIQSGSTLSIQPNSFLSVTGGIAVTAGAGSPEGVVSGTQGDLFNDYDNVEQGILYVKTGFSSGTTGWNPLQGRDNAFFFAPIISEGYINYHLDFSLYVLTPPSPDFGYLRLYAKEDELGVPKMCMLDASGVETPLGSALPVYTVATLPAGVLGDTAVVSDAVSPTYLGALTGGGSVACPVFFNGTAWVSH
jgi:hypothetical protein